MKSGEDFISGAAKSWLRSKGAVGSAAAAVLGLALTYQLTGQVSPVESVELVSLIIAAGVAFGGRLQAKKTVKLW